MLGILKFLGLWIGCVIGFGAIGLIAAFLVGQIEKLTGRKAPAKYWAVPYEETDLRAEETAYDLANIKPIPY